MPQLATAHVMRQHHRMFEPIPVALLFVIASGLGALKLADSRIGLTVLTVLWLLYSVYEFLMYKRILCTGECNIRIDLLLIYPLILGSTGWLYAAAGLRAIRRRRNASKA